MKYIRYYFQEGQEIFRLPALYKKSENVYYI